jgi:hypothetical protein
VSRLWGSCLQGLLVPTSVHNGGSGRPGAWGDGAEERG